MKTSRHDAMNAKNISNIMKRGFVIIFCILCISLNARSEDSKATLQDIILLAQSNVSDETIIAFLETREVNFAVGAKEILELKNAGVSENVIRYLLERIRPNESKAYVQPDYYYGAYSYGALINTCYGSAFFFSFNNYQQSSNYFQMNGHNYFRHNGHFHQDDVHQYASFSQSTPEKFFSGSTWGSRKIENVNGNRLPKWQSNYANKKSSNNSVKGHIYGSFKNGRTKSGNSWGTRSGNKGSRSN